MKKLSRNGKSKWESRTGNLFDYPFDTAKVHTKVESTKYISSFFHTNRERLFVFFPPRGLYPSEVREKTYTSLTTPGLYFISSRKCEIAQSAIYQKISRHLKLFLNIIFVKSLPKQISLHFFCSPPTFFLVAPREKHHFVASHSPKPTICRLRHRAYFLLPRRFDAQAAAIGKPLRHLLHAVDEQLRIAPHCAPHTPPPRTKNGESRRKNWGLSPKNGGVPIETPPFYPPACTHAAQARTQKRTAPQFICTVLFI